jgi:hypothetical protein
VPDISPEEAERIKQEFNENMSDDEDNSWADEITEHAADDEYGDEDEAEDYGEEASPDRALEEASIVF